MTFNQSVLLPHLLAILPFFFHFYISHCCYEYERTSLLSFKSLLSDPSGRLSSWHGRNCCSWHGIHCSTSSHVVKLDLRNPFPDTYMRNYYSVIVNISSKSTTLNGTISPSLFNLTRLEYLDLSFNNFHFSEIPHKFSNFKNLTYLNLSNSIFSGSITTQFSNLSSLRYLDISCSMQIVDFTSFSYNLKTSQITQLLTFSYLSTSSLSSRNIDWVRGLVNLKVLSLVGVDLSHLVSSTLKWAEPISSLSDLRELYLSDCRVTSLIPINEFLNLSRLSVLTMASNFLNTSIPIQLANFTSLTSIDLSNSHLKGSIPYIPQLMRLNVDFNHDLIVDLAQMFHLPWPRLKHLSICSTQVLGPIPNSILKAPLLVSFLASSCSIQGPLPTSITSLSQLEHLDLSLNNITGYLPSTISKLQNLKVLYLLQNKFQGSIPKSLCEISSLQVLVLGSNRLTRTIPSCINKFRNLTMLDVADNSVEGNFELNSLINDLNLHSIMLSSNRITIDINRKPLLPTKFQLQTLELGSCNLTGNIPSFICNMTSLIRLRLSGNNLVGSIPPCLFKLPNLSYLDLSNNSLQGTLPRSLHISMFYPSPTLNLANNNFEGRLPLPPQNIGSFDLSQNKFSGGISNEVGERLSNAGFVSLSSNELSGSIPFSLCSKVNFLMHLDLSNNTLSETIPSSLQHCTSLLSLNLGKNNLNGNVPKALQKLRKLKYLQLNENNFSGSFPSFVKQLHDLQVLNLESNNFEGSIPTFICSHQNLKIISLRSNKFSGSIPYEITHLQNLQILDLSMNKLSGLIPKNMGNLKMLTSRPNTKFILGDVVSLMYSGVQLQMVTKGNLQHFESVHNYNSGIDLSSNYLEGNIPQEMGLLKGLAMLNLSRNHISGKIPTSLGNMRGLESLDLSFNKLDGDIPLSLTSIDSLGALNLSYNNLNGVVPRGQHFDTLSVDGSAYIGNPLLCGYPTKKICDKSNDSNTNNEEDDEDSRDKWLFYGVVVIGFGVGFWGLFLVLLIRKEKWWSGYWRGVDSLSLRMFRCISKRNGRT